MTATRVFRHSPIDVRVLGAALAHGAALVALGVAAAAGPVPPALVVVLLAAGICWGSNTVSHIHLHAPLFRSEATNRAFSLYLSVLLSVPQRWWKRRHLQHHGLTRIPLGRDGLVEILAVLASIAALALLAPQLFATVYLPAQLLGLGLCAVQGREEHARSDAGVDHHGRLYNRLWFNDGFHAAHHRAPGAHWTSLPDRAAASDTTSPLPPVLRWLEEARALVSRLCAGALDRLEAATIDLRPVRRLLLATHRQALARLLAPIDRAGIREATIVGGGLFPRTALLLSELLPDAHLTVVDAVPAHLERARALLGPHAERMRFVSGVYGPGGGPPPDLLVFPLAFRGDRRRLYQQPPGPLLLVHDWIWRVRGARSARVSLLLLKRINLVRR